MDNLEEKSAQALKAIRKTAPLIHNITNFVVANYTANALLSMGASPVMAHAKEEVEEIVEISSALVLNIGTLTPNWVDAMVLAGKKACQVGIPIVFDPVGSGATKLRTLSAKKIIQKTDPKVIKGNASEILSLHKTDTTTKGVDAIHSVNEAKEDAIILARKFKAAIAITGQVDIVTDGKRVVHIINGHELMGQVTGTGCTATAIIGAFLAVEQDPVIASAAALAFWGVAGERAAKKSKAPGSYMIALLDALYSITPADLLEHGRIEQE